MWGRERQRGGERLKIREAKKEVNFMISELGLGRGSCLAWLLY